MKPRIIAIIQARMGSSRLPGKVLLDIAGQPMLARVAERARRAGTVQQVVVATTTDPSDDAVAALCRERGYPCHRGSLHDVLDRFYGAAKAAGAEVVARLTGDCPLIDPELIDRTVTALFEEPPAQDPAASAQPPTPTRAFAPVFDFTANRLPPPWPRTYPIGLDVEVCTFAALERAWREADQPFQREHVMPYLYEDYGRPDARFRVRVVDHERDYGFLRWTVDTPEDLELIRRIYARFPGRDDFSWLEVLALFEREPELARINAGVPAKNVHDVDQRRKG